MGKSGRSPRGRSASVKGGGEGQILGELGKDETEGKVGRKHGAPRPDTLTAGREGSLPGGAELTARHRGGETPHLPKETGRGEGLQGAAQEARLLLPVGPHGDRLCARLPVDKAKAGQKGPLAGAGHHRGGVEGGEEKTLADRCNRGGARRPPLRRGRQEGGGPKVNFPARRGRSPPAPPSNCQPLPEVPASTPPASF